MATAFALSLLLAGLMLSVPELHTVAHRLVHARWGWVGVACGLEIASCVGYVLAFQGTFRRLPSRFAALVAASELAFGAVVPLGGAGGIAAGGWLLARSGMPVRRIAERSAVLFLLTSATNVAALLLAAGGLMLGVFNGPHDLLRAALPAAVALIALVICLLLARQATGERSQQLAPRRAGAVRALATTLAQTLQLIRRPGWRVAVGAPGYLLCDVASLWLAIRALGHAVPVAPLLVAYLVGYLANAVPVPGGLGVLDGGLAGALVAYHVPAATALGGVIIYHALALWIPTVSGTLAFIAAARVTGRAPHRDARPSRPGPRGPESCRRVAAGHDDPRVPVLGLDTRSST